VKSSPQNQTAPAGSADDCLDPEIKDIVSRCSVKTRLMMAEDMIRHAHQIQQSVAIMTGKPLATPGNAPKIPKGFVLVNLSTREQKELRDLARECRFDLRGALRNALFWLREDLKERAKFIRTTGEHPHMFLGVHLDRN
jgi:hypothetical protein